MNEVLDKRLDPPNDNETLSDDDYYTLYVEV